MEENQNIPMKKTEFHGCRAGYLRYTGIDLIFSGIGIIIIYLKNHILENKR